MRISEYVYKEVSFMMRETLEFFKLLSDETRFRVIMLLMEKELAVCELVGILDLPQPKVSKALAKLRELGLVLDERKEKYMYYSLNAKKERFIKILKETKNSCDNLCLVAQDTKKLKEKNYTPICCDIDKNGVEGDN